MGTRFPSREAVGFKACVMDFDLSLGRANIHVTVGTWSVLEILVFLLLGCSVVPLFVLRWGGGVRFPYKPLKQKRAAVLEAQ